MPLSRRTFLPVRASSTERRTRPSRRSWKRSVTAVARPGGPGGAEASWLLSHLPKVFFCTSCRSSPLLMLAAFSICKEH